MTPELIPVKIVILHFLIVICALAVLCAGAAVIWAGSRPRREREGL